MRDGVLLATDLFMLEGPGPFPAKHFEGVRKPVQSHTTRPNESLSDVGFDVSMTD